MNSFNVKEPITLRGRKSTSRTAISFYPHGVVTERSVHIVPKKDIGGKRGKVKGWSKASRYRMRDFMLTWSPPEGWSQYGVTITIPGPVVTPQEAKRFWDHYCKNVVVRRGWCMVWRVEMQERGQYHWHAILSMPPDVQPGHITLSALDALDILPPAAGPCTYMGQEVEMLSCPRSEWPGAQQHAVDVQLQSEAGAAWKRYLQDHASKYDADQTDGIIGRHWGVVGRKHYQKSNSLLEHCLPEAEYKKVLRGMRKMCRPTIKDEKAPFGTKRGWTSKRGTRGKAVWFMEKSKMDALARMIKQARERAGAENVDPENPVE